MKHFIYRFILACVVSSMALACGTGEKKTPDQAEPSENQEMERMQQKGSPVSTIQADSAAEAVEEAKTEVEITEVTPDMARQELNGGKVKRVTMHIYSPLNNMTNKTISFDAQGNQIFKSGVIVKKDKTGRVTKTFAKDKENYTEEFFSYAESSRLAYGEEVGGYVDSEEGNMPEAGDYRHYQYADNTNNPQGFFSICCQDISPAYTEYKYLEFDQFGNWTKRESIVYTFDYTSAYVGQYEKLMENLEAVFPYYKKNKVEPQLISFIKKSCKHPEKMIETRKIEYFDF